MSGPSYGVPESYPGEVRELVNILDGERQEIAHVLGTDHPLFMLVDGALRSHDTDELRVAYAATNGWPSGGRDNIVLY